MDVACRAINMIYLLICLLPFPCYRLISFLPFFLLYIFFFFYPRLLFLFSVSPKSYSVFQFLVPSFILHHILLAFSLHWPTAFRSNVIRLCLSPFCLLLQYPDRQTCSFVALFAAFKIFLFIIPFLFSSTPGAATTRSKEESEKSPQYQGDASYHVCKRCDTEYHLVLWNNLLCLLSASAFKSIAFTSTACF